jgi:hypothetical protein
MHELRQMRRNLPDEGDTPQQIQRVRVGANCVRPQFRQKPTGDYKSPLQSVKRHSREAVPFLVYGLRGRL